MGMQCCWASTKIVGCGNIIFAVTHRAAAAERLSPPITLGMGAGAVARGSTRPGAQAIANAGLAAGFCGAMWQRFGARVARSAGFSHARGVRILGGPWSLSFGTFLCRRYASHAPTGRTAGGVRCGGQQQHGQPHK